MESKSVASRCRELLQFLSSVKGGDLANVTGPPALLAPLSVVEAGNCWAERPAVFAAPALEPAPDRRALLVLRLVLIALKQQMYVGGSPAHSIRKPLNAFLGELFFAEWTEGRGSCDTCVPCPEPSTLVPVSSASDSASSSESISDSASASSDSKSAALSSSTSISGASAAAPSTSHFTTRLVAEQVSHHPPITAMHIADEAHGVRADGYARVEMTFAGSVLVRQVGHAVLRVDAYDEEYLIPLPDLRVRGFLSGRLYPEITETCHVASSSGYTSEIRFSGAGYLRGRRNAFTAKVFAPGPDRNVCYTIDGVWSEAWTVRDANGSVLEKYAVDAPVNAPAPMVKPPSPLPPNQGQDQEQDPWESRRAWAAVLESLRAGDLSRTVAEKSRIEQAQRRMRAREAAAGTAWVPLFFHDSPAAHQSFQRLAGVVEATAGPAARPQLNADRTKGVWRIDKEKLRTVKRPFYKVTPLGEDIA